VSGIRPSWAESRGDVTQACRAYAELAWQAVVRAPLFLGGLGTAAPHAIEFGGQELGAVLFAVTAASGKGLQSRVKCRRFGLQSA
jgi:hypothetical protein